MAGQTEVIEHIAMPDIHGFQKHFNLVFMPEQNLQMDPPLAETARTYLTSAHDWMFKHSMHQTGHHYLDEYAMTMHRDVQSAVEEWLTTQGTDNAMHNKYCKIKLRCWSTDLLRLAHANMRIGQLTAATWSRSNREAKRTEPNAYEFLLALHMWLRQFHIHASFYRWCTLWQKNAKEGPEPDTEYTDYKLSPQRPWRRRHLDMQEDCRVCQMSYALTASMADAGLAVPARPDPIPVPVSTMGQSYTVWVLPTAIVLKLKVALSRRVDCKLGQIKLYAGFRLLANNELVVDLRTQHISAIIRS